MKLVKVSRISKKALEALDKAGYSVMVVNGDRSETPPNKPNLKVLSNNDSRPLSC